MPVTTTRHKLNCAKQHLVHPFSINLVGADVAECHQTCNCCVLRNVVLGPSEIVGMPAGSLAGGSANIDPRAAHISIMNSYTGTRMCLSMLERQQSTDSYHSRRESCSLAARSGVFLLQVLTQQPYFQSSHCVDSSSVARPFPCTAKLETFHSPMSGFHTQHICRCIWCSSISAIARSPQHLILQLPCCNAWLEKVLDRDEVWQACHALNHDSGLIRPSTVSPLAK